MRGLVMVCELDPSRRIFPVETVAAEVKLRLEWWLSEVVAVPKEMHRL